MVVTATSVTKDPSTCLKTSNTDVPNASVPESPSNVAAAIWEEEHQPLYSMFRNWLIKWKFTIVPRPSDLPEISDIMRRPRLIWNRFSTRERYRWAATTVPSRVFTTGVCLRGRFFNIYRVQWYVIFFLKKLLTALLGKMSDTRQSTRTVEFILH